MPESTARALSMAHITLSRRHWLALQYAADLVAEPVQASPSEKNHGRWLSRWLDRWLLVYEADSFAIDGTPDEWQRVLSVFVAAGSMLERFTLAAEALGMVREQRKELATC
jgi:hypothetical protein